jgi:predicted AAA+ superfamily ATPase
MTKVLLVVDEEYINNFLVIGSRGMGKNTIALAKADAQALIKEIEMKVAQDIMNLYIESNDFVGDMQKKYLGE